MKKRAAAAIFLLSGTLSLHYLKAQKQPAPLTQSQISAEVRFVAAGIMDGRDQIKCGQAVVTHYQKTPKEFFDYLRLHSSTKEAARLPIGDEEKTQTAWWYYQNSKLSMFVEEDRTSPQEILLYQRIVTDAKNARILQAYKNPARKQRGVYYVGAIIPVETAIQNGLRQNSEFLDPRFYAYYYTLERSLDQLFLDKSVSPSYKGEEVIEGSRCMKVEVWLSEDEQSIFWIDVEHGFLARREAEYVRVENKMQLSREVRVPSIVESNGVWLPAIVERKDFLLSLQGRGRDKGAITPPTILKRVTISDFKTHCEIPPMAFILDWPLGTNVSDGLNNSRFLVDSDDGKKEEKSAARDQ